MDANGNLFIGDTGTARIYKVTAAGVLSIFAGTGGTGAPANGSATSSAVVPDSMTIDTAGTLYVGWLNRAYVLKITAAGVLSTVIGTGTPGAPGLGVIVAGLTAIGKPAALALDAAGNLYVGDITNNRVYRIALVGLTISSFAGNGTVGPPVPGSASSPVPLPTAMTVDSAGTLFVSESYSHQILGFVTTGTGAPALVAGTGGTGAPVPGVATGSPLGGTLALAATGADTVLVADTSNNYLLRLTAPTVPDAPTGLSAAPAPSSAVLTFSAPASTGGSAITGYQVTTNGGLTWTTLATTGGATRTGTLTGLVNGLTYTVQVRAVNAVGASAASAGTTVTPATAPGVPTLPSAVGGDASITMIYTAPLDNGGSAVTGYQTSIDGGGTWVTLPANNTITGLTNGMAYTVLLRAVNAVGPGAATAGLTATPRGAPAAPTGLTAVAGNRQAVLTFTTPADGGYPILGYQVSTDDGSTWSGLTVTTSGTVNTGTVTGLANGTTYRIRVRAQNLGGNGTPSSAVTVTPPVVPADAPTGLTATSGSGTATLSFADPANPGGPITGYQVSTDNGSTWSALDVTTGLLGVRNATVSGLTNGVTYAIRVRVVNAAGPGAASDPASATPRGVPYAPAGLSAVAGDRQATLTFTTPGDGGYPILGYQVSTDDGSTWNGLTVTTSGTVNTGTVTGLANGTTYPIRVRAVNLAGTGPASSAVTVTLVALPPDAPTGLTVTTSSSTGGGSPGGGSPGSTGGSTGGGSTGGATASLSFNAPANTGGSPITGYEVSTDNGATWAPITVTTGLSGVQQGTVTGLTNGTTYAFRVRAVNTAGKGAASAAVSATPRDVPYAPTDLTAAAGDRQATLTFTTPGDGGYPLLGYQVSTDDGSTWNGLTVTTSGTVNTGTVTGLANGTTYAIRVRAVNLAGAGAASGPATVTLAAVPPDAPTGLVAVAGDTTAALTFNAPGNTGGSPITGYEVSTDDGTTWTPADVSTGLLGVRNATVNGLTNGVTYPVRVRAVTAAGAGAASAAVTVTPRGMPYAPTALTVVPGNGQATLTFTTPGDGGYPLLGYQVSTDDGSTWNGLTVTTSGTVNTGTVTGLTNGTTYRIRVRAQNLAGAGPATAAVPVVPATVPGAPTGVTVTAGNTEATVTFTPPADTGGSPITGYQVSTDNGGTWVALPANGLVTGLTNNTTYAVRVRAVNAIGAGAASAAVNVTPIPATPDPPTGLTAVRGDRSAALTFQAPAMTGTSPISGYEVSTDNGGTWTALPADRVVTGLTNGTTYTVRVRAVNVSGAGPASAAATVTPATVPDAPGPLTVTAGDRQVLLTFAPPSGTSGGGTTGGGTTGGGTSGGGTSGGGTSGGGTTGGGTTGGGTSGGGSSPGDGGDPVIGYEVSTDDGATWAPLATDRVVTGLSNGTTYRFRVRAVNSVGPGPATAAVEATPATIPGAPSDVSAVPGDGRAVLSFTAPATGGSAITGYETSIDGGATWTPLAADRTVTGLRNGTTYAIQVRAVNAVGAGPASTGASVTPDDGRPGAPAGLTATPGDRRITLAFTPPDRAVTGYEVSLDGGATWTALPDDRTVTGLINGTSYDVQVRAVNEAGAGPATASVTVTPGTTPGAPTGLAATRGDASATVTFTPPADTGGSPVTGYQVSTDDGRTYQDLPADRTINGLTNGVTYPLRVRAVTRYGPGSASGRALVTPAGLPGAPANPVASAGDGQAVLMFTAPDDGGDAITGYQVSIDGGGFRDLPGDNTINGLTNGTTYTLRVRAVNTVGAGPASASTTVTPAAGLPGAPSGLTAMRGNASITVAFTPPAGPVTGYDTTVDGGATWQPLPTDNRITGLTNGTAYVVRVRARNTTGPGPASDPATATPATTPGAPGGLSATPGDSSAILRYAAPADDGGDAITGYQVSIDGGGFRDLPGDNTINGLTNGTTYTLRVRAVNTVGAGPASASTTVTPAAGVPGAPSGLTVTRGDRQITVAFTPPDGPVTGYEYSIDDGVTWQALPGDDTITGLTNGTSYTVRVRARNGSATGPASDGVTVIPAAVPGAPGPVTATAGNSTATITFTPPADDGGSPITGYQVLARSTAPGAGAGDSWTTLEVSGSTTLTGTVANLTNGTTYAVRVRAVNAVGAGAPTASATVTPVTVPGRVPALNASAGDGRAVLMFTAPGDDGGSAITGYEFSLDDSAWTTVPADHTVTGLTNGTTYHVRVRAVNAVGAGAASDTATVTPTAGLPGAPTGLTATRGDSSATVAFTAPAGPVTGYEFSTDDGWNWAPLAADRRIPGLTNGTTYTVRVRAVNDRGSGPASASATVTPAAVPGRPTGLRAVAGDRSASVTFAAPDSDGGSPITGYEVSTDDGGTWVVLAADGKVTGLVNGTTYAVRVRAVNDVGPGPESTAVTVTPIAAPGAPTGLTATAADSAAVLDFTAPPGPVNAYEVSTDDGASWSPLAANRTVTGLTNGTTYRIRVRARNDAGPGTVSNAVTVTPAAVPGRPSGLTAAPGNGTATLTFTAPAGPVDGYEVSVDDGVTWAPLAADRTVPGLTNGNTYTVRVRALNAVGAGPASAGVQVTPRTTPGAPTGLTAAPADSSITVSFTAPADAGGSPITGYDVSVDDGGTWAALAADRTVTGLTNGTTYGVRVRARNAAGAGPAGPSASATPVAGLPGMPAGLVVTRGDASAGLSFTAGTGRVTGYQVSVDDGVNWSALPVTTTDDAGTTTLTATVTGLTNGTTYAVRVRAANTVGTSPPTAAVTVTPATRPSAPTGLVATAGDRSATLAFTAPASGGNPITGYQVSIDGGGFRDLAGDNTITGLTNGRTYTLRVRAVNSVGAGPASTSVTVTPVAVPGAPTGVAARRGNGSATVTFTAPADTGGSPITGYDVSTDDGVTWQALPAGGTVTGLSNGTAYAVRVRARNAVGAGPASDAVTVVPATVPGAPTGLRAAPADASAVLTFTAPTDNGGDPLLGYEASTDDGSTWTPLTVNASGAAVNGRVTGLRNGTAYRIRVRARNGAGAGAPSASTTVTPAAGETPPAVPAAPAQLSAVPGAASATLTVTPGADGGSPVTAYEFSVDGGTTWQPLPADNVIHGLTNGTSYTISVRAVNAVGAGPARTTAVTPRTVPAAPAVTAAAGDSSVTLTVTPGADGGAPITAYQVSLNDGTTWQPLPTNATPGGPTPAPGSGSTATPGSGPTATPGSGTTTTPGSGTTTVPGSGTASGPVVGTVTGLTNGTAYRFLVRALNAAGPGPAGTPVTATPIGGLPGSPGPLTISPGNGSATLSFTPAAGDPTGYEVSIDGGVTWRPLPADRMVAGLRNGTSYAIAVRAVNTAGAGPATPAVTVVPATTPGAPDVVSIVFSGTTATVTFTAPADDGGAFVSGYDVSVDGGATWAAVSVTGSGPLVATVTGLSAGTTYSVVVRARNAVGAGPASSEFAVGVPAAPTAVVVTRSGTSATVTFTAPDDDTVTGYQVSLDGGNTWVTLPADGVLTGLDPAGTYTVRVRAVNASGPGRASTAVTSAPVGPGAPRAVTATAGTSSVLVTWAPPVSSAVPIVGYRVVADPGPATCEVGPSVTSCTLGAVAGVRYTVRVVALAAGDRSTSSAPSAAVLPNAPVVPAAPPASAPSLTTSRGDITTAEPGARLALIGSGFAAHSTVTLVLYSTPRSLGTVVTDAAGTFSKTVTVPADLPAGRHTFLATGVDPAGRSFSRTLTVTVKAASAAPSPASPAPAPSSTTVDHGGDDLLGMPKTGANIALVAATGLLLIGAGVALLLIRRRTDR
ncbi:fibronectin type III domain-containing protein [Actinoplanes sp. N902-109]|uniref:fibronectin type III domain-containing protein n=1 Tax=Actinoplanes sp. (strain N902-109) TaxID=649831 RepID=UPI0003294EBE|nr:fibronectin type III domain-containing protein [Actinoplanes sp. N902-109]AGL16845.1 fibronectin type III domain-containing protein [Actinoplanes sp. N902-109]